MNGYARVLALITTVTAPALVVAGCPGPDAIVGSPCSFGGGSCESCALAACSDVMMTCGATAGCCAIVVCSLLTQCTMNCYQEQTCKDVIDEAGGPDGEAVKLLSGLGACLTERCPDVCNFIDGGSGGGGQGGSGAAGGQGGSGGTGG